jgi:hypothetical protein
MSRRVKDEGASERRPVTGRIGVELPGDITPPERAQTSLGSSLTREPWPTDSGGKADLSADQTSAGAAPGLAVDWHSIDWRKVHRNVRRLQARIVKAVREGRWGKVKALVYLLTHSFCGRALAILRVVTNSGAKTPEWTKSCGTPRRPGRPLSAPCAGTATSRNRSAGCTSPRVTARCVRWAYPRCGIGLCRRYTCSAWIRSRKPWRTIAPSGSAQAAVAPTHCGDATRSCADQERPGGSSKGTSSRATTGSATTG